MVRTARQLKALVRNMSKGNSAKAQVIIRNYVMERFLERLSLSNYRNNLILKGGTLVSAIVGLDNRSTMDMDATIKNLPLSEESALRIVEEIAAIEIDDCMTFEVKGVTYIMESADYPAIRVSLEATLETMRTPLKIDFSTGDVITPKEIEYSYKLLFEERTITIMAYNLETVLAEKLETLLVRGTANTRMRDFYDIYALEDMEGSKIDSKVLRAAFKNTSEKRGSLAVVADMEMVLSEIERSAEMESLWENYRHKYEYAAMIGWGAVMQAVKRLCNIASGA